MTNKNVFLFIFLINSDTVELNFFLNPERNTFYFSFTKHTQQSAQSKVLKSIQLKM